MSGAGSAATGKNDEGKSGAVTLYRLAFKLSVPGDPEVSEEGEASFREDILSIRSDSGKALGYSVRDMDWFEAKDYRVAVGLHSGALLELYYLGYKYEDFVDILTVTRNKFIRQDLLFHEKLLYTAEAIRYQHFSHNGVAASAGDCDAQVSETALILAEPGGNHIKFPLSYFTSIADEDFNLRVFMETGDVIVLSMLGRQREPLRLNIEGAVRNLTEQARLFCADLFPGLDESSLIRLSDLFKDGRAVTKASLESISPLLWDAMEKRLGTYGIEQGYDYLKESGDICQAAIGFKRGLMGDLTGEYVWFLIPVKAAGRWLIAMEAGMSEGTGGRATYFYALPVNKPEYSAAQAADFIRLLNYNLLMVNFRREPIYLSDEMLEKPAFHQYKYAIERLPSLRLLRSLFTGRAVHSSEEAWKKEVSRILGKS